MLLILLVITLLLLYVIYFSIKKNNHKKELFSLLQFNKNSIHFNNYLNSIHKAQYCNKIPIPNCKTLHKNNFKKKYISLIKDVPIKYKKMLNSYTNKIDKLFTKRKLHIFNKVPWIFFMSIENLEDNMPFTLDKYIIVSDQLLENEFNTIKKYFNPHFINTLIHEKIHVIQRMYQKEFDTFYLKKYTFLSSKISVNRLPNKIKRIYMTNPDSNNSIWIYKYQGIKIFPILIKKNNKYSDYAINIHNLKKFNLDKIKNNYVFSNHVSFYHPNEIFACTFSHDIMDNSIEDDFMFFFNYLDALNK